MCRIAGFYLANPTHSLNYQLILSNMNDSLAHGGPDASGLFLCLPVGLAHRRLSIIDLSPSGAQPMQYEDYTIVFNGEIYNYAAIKLELLALNHHFKGNSDTEVLLHSYQQWGCDAFSRFRGMFSFALWDKKAAQLIICRDRLGVKPLFYYQKDNVFLFASELKALLQFPDFDKTINPKAVSLFLQLGYVPATECIYQYVNKLAPAHYLVIDTNNKKATELSCYWDINHFYNNPLSIPDNLHDLQLHTEAQLAESFQLRMVADVPVGAFLSGGVDSSLVVALLTQKLGHKLNTFTIGFEDKSHNEAHFAAAVAAHCQTNHTELYCTEKDFINIVPKLPYIYDEPFGDSSAVPTFLVSQLAKQSVKVSLSADGADELFGGYTKYEATLNYFPKLYNKPNWIKQILKFLLKNVSASWLEKNKKYIPIVKNYNNLNYKLPKLLNAVDAVSVTDFFVKSSTYINIEQLQKLVLPTYNPLATLQFPTLEAQPNRLLSQLACADIATYLEGDILTKIDRATMHNALEGREPFLDHNLVELALSIKDNFKINTQTKLLLRNILYQYVPKSMIERPKQGFTVPVSQWLKTILADDLKNIQNDKQFAAQLFLNHTELSKIINQFQQNNTTINPSLVWFIHSLWQWYKVYLQ